MKTKERDENFEKFGYPIDNKDVFEALELNEHNCINMDLPIHTDTLAMRKPKQVVIVGSENTSATIRHLSKDNFQADVVIIDEAKRNEAILAGRSSGMELTKQQWFNVKNSIPTIKPFNLEKQGERKPLTKKQRKARKAKRRIVKQSKRK